jgi:hypothetical protein
MPGAQQQMGGQGGAGPVFDVRQREAVEAEARAEAERAAVAAREAEAIARRQLTAKVYAEEVVPLLDAYDQRNHEAAARAVADARERLGGRRWGIKPFVKDVGSWRTRFGVIGRTTKDAWAKVRRRPAADREKVREYVQAKFRHHVLSEQALSHDVGASLKQFHEDVDASRNRLYADLRLPLAKIRVPGVTPDDGFEALRADVARRSAAMGQAWATDSVVTGLGSFVGGWVAADVAQAVGTRTVAAVLARVGTQMATQTLAAGGATAAGAATGGGGGSFAGPAGTVIGLGVGVAVGAAIDWWMSERFEARMTAQLNAFFDSVEGQLVTGTEQAPGLQKALDEAVRMGGAAQRAALEAAIKESVR